MDGLRLLTVPGGRPDLDETLKAAAAATPTGEPLRVRLQPSVRIPGNDSYVALSGVIWILDVPDLATAVAFREDLDAYVRQWVEGKGQA